MRISDWSSDVCSSDLARLPEPAVRLAQVGNEARIEVVPGLLEAPVAPQRLCQGELQGDLARSQLHGLAEALQRLRIAPPLLIDQALVVHILAAIGRSEEHTSELQSLMRISYAVFFL